MTLQSQFQGGHRTWGPIPKIGIRRKLIHNRERGTYNEIAIKLAPGTRLHRSRFKVINVVIEDNVDAAVGNILLNPLAVLVRVDGIQKLSVRVDNGNLLVGERILNLARIF